MAEEKESKQEVLVMTMRFSDSRIPDFKKVNGKAYIFFGEDDKYPNELLNLYNKSAKHNAIINGKVNYIFGGGLQCDNQEDGNATAWLSKVNEAGDTLDELAKKSILDSEVFGGYYWHIIRDRAGNIAEIYHLDFRKVRSNIDNSMFYFKRNWADRNEDIKELPAFMPSAKDVTSSIYFFSEYRPGIETYCLPGYVGSINYIESDIEISKHTLTNAKTGFSASKFINFYNGEPTPEAKRDITRKLEDRVTGSEGKKLIIGFNQDPAKRPTVDDLGASDISKEDFNHVDDLIAQNIYAGHQITSPMLFGIQEPGKLGGHNELRISYEIFKNTYVSNKQQQLEKVINRFAGVKGLASKFSFKPTDPVGVEFSDSTLLQAAPRSWVLDKMGIDTAIYTDAPIGTKDSQPTGTGTAPEQMVNDNLKNLTAKQHQQLARIIREFNKGKWTTAQATLMLQQSIGVSEDEAKILLGIEDQFSKKYSEEDVADMFEECGTKCDEFIVVRSKKVMFESDKEALDYELDFYQNKAFDFGKDLTEVDTHILNILQKNKLADTKSIAEALSLDESYVRDRLKSLEERKLITSKITTNAGEEIVSRTLTKPLSEIKKVDVKLPQIFIKYSYEKDPKAGGDIIIPTTRPFCRKLVQLDRFYSRVEIEKISERLGYSVWDRRGGFWGDSPSCRHIWKSNVLIKKA